MYAPAQFDQDLFHVLLFGKTGRDLLLEVEPNGFRLPTVTVPRQTRIAEEITTTIRTSWSLGAYCLFELPSLDYSEAQIPFQVVEAIEPTGNAPAGLHWVPVNSLSSATISATEYATIERTLTALDDYRQGRLPGAFGRLGWLQEVTNWVREQASAIGLRLTGTLRQLNASTTFSLLRFGTDGPALWFKAVGEPNLHEYSITQKLADAFPEFLPQIVGSNRDWNAWLAVEGHGSVLDTDSLPQAWEIAAENLALMQAASIGRRFELIDAGCRDLRPYVLGELIEPFFEAMAMLMELQSKPSPAPLKYQELMATKKKISEALEALGDGLVPNTLGHRDLNPGNVLASEQRCLFLDWAEAYIGPPFFTFAYLAEHLRRIHPNDLERQQSLRSSYVGPWTAFVSQAEIAAAFRVLPLLAAYTYAAGSLVWRGPGDLPQSKAAYFRSLVRRMKREADVLDQERYICVP